MSLNKYQVLFALCAVLLIFICKRSYAPYPNYRIPHTQILEERALPQAGVSIDRILEQKPSWTGASRNSFDVETKYVAKVIKKEEVKEKVKPPEIIPEKKPVIVLKPPDVVPPKKDPPPQPPPPKNSGVVPFKPPAPNTGRPNLVENIVKKPDPQPATGQPVIKEEPYRLPFRFMGIINANESEGPMVLLRDEATGRVVRRREGQSYQDEVNIIKISPSSVEVEVPSKKLRFLYVDSLRQWKQF